MTAELNPTTAFLIVNGANIFSLRKNIVNIGRMEDNDIVISNVHVSRYHAQLRQENGEYVLLDLNSTSGTSVNGEKTSQKILSAGDVIVLAGVPIIYGKTRGARKLEEDDQKSLINRAIFSAKREITAAIDVESVDEFIEMFDTPAQDNQNLDEDQIHQQGD